MLEQDKRNFMNTKKNLIKNCIDFERNDFTAFREKVLNFIDNDLKFYFYKNQNMYQYIFLNSLFVFV